MKKVKLTALLMVCLLVVPMILTACGGTSKAPQTASAPAANPAPSTEPAPNPESAEPTPAAKLTKVRIAVLPYLDYTLFVAAKSLGLDKEQNLDFELVPFTLENQSVQALMNGSVDVAQGALGSFAPLMPQAPEMRVIMNNNQYMGFVFTGREGVMKSFNALYTEHNQDFAAAQQATIQQFKGKTICMVESSFSSMLKSTLELAGLTYGDVTVLNFSSDAQAATAFMTGEGDLYTGGLPQSMMLMKEGFPSIAGADVLGPAGLWYSNTAVLQSYVDENPDIVSRLLAVHYKACRMLENDPDTVLPTMLDYLRNNASSDLTIDDAKVILEHYTDFETLEEAGKVVFDPASPSYWRLAMEMFVQQGEALGNIESGALDIDTFVVQEKIYKDFLARQDLVNYVNS